MASAFASASSSSSAASEACSVCGAAADRACLLCGGEHYCSAAHQYGHWLGAHKGECDAALALVRSSGQLVSYKETEVGEPG
jgi:hypothetical protein